MQYRRDEGNARHSTFPNYFQDGFLPTPGNGNRWKIKSTIWLSFRLLTINRSFPPLINTSRSIFPSTLKLLDNWSLSLSLFLWTRVHYSLAKSPPPFSVQKFLFRNGNSRFSRCHAMEFRQSNVRRMKEWKKKEGERERKKRIDGFYRILERRRRRRRRGLPPN